MQHDEIKYSGPAAELDTMSDPDGFEILDLFATSVDCALFGNDAALVDKVHEVQADIRSYVTKGEFPELLAEALERSDRLRALVDAWGDAVEAPVHDCATVTAFTDRIRLEVIQHELAVALWFRDRFRPSAT